MKEQRKIDVYRIEYEIPPTMQMYTASIAAETHEAALEHLGKVMGKSIHVTTSGIVCPLHDLTPFVRQLLTGVGAQAKTPKATAPVDEPDLHKSGRGRKPATKE